MRTQIFFPETARTHVPSSSFHKSNDLAVEPCPLPLKSIPQRTPLFPKSIRLFSVPCHSQGASAKTGPPFPLRASTTSHSIPGSTVGPSIFRGATYRRSGLPHLLPYSSPILPRFSNLFSLASVLRAYRRLMRSKGRDREISRSLAGRWKRAGCSTQRGSKLSRFATKHRGNPSGCVTAG